MAGRVRSLVAKKKWAGKIGWEEGFPLHDQYMIYLSHNDNYVNF